LMQVTAETAAALVSVARETQDVLVLVVTVVESLLLFRPWSPPHSDGRPPRNLQAHTEKATTHSAIITTLYVLW
jgi:hypothetical protein